MFGAGFVDRDGVGDGPWAAFKGLAARFWVVLARHGWDLAGWRCLGDLGVPAYLYVPGAARGGLAVEDVNWTVFCVFARFGIV